MTRRATLTTTRSGVTIGLAFVPKRPLRSITRSEDEIQSALINRRQRIDWSGVVIAVFMVALLVAALFIGPRGA